MGGCFSFWRGVMRFLALLGIGKLGKHQDGKGMRRDER